MFLREWSDKPSPQYVANNTLRDFYFISLMESGQIFYYDRLSGVWRPNGDKLIRSAMRKEFPNCTIAEQREVIRFIEDNTSTRIRNFKQDAGWVACKNGEIFLRTMTFDGGFDPTHHIRVKYNVVYESWRRCPKFMKFMKQILPDPQDRLTVLECLASVFVPHINFEKAYMFIGSGANGKSTLLNIFKELLDPDSFCAISIHSLIYNRFSAAELDGRIANIYPDINSKVINELDRFKMIISGEAMTVERKNGHPFQLKPMTRHFFSANQPPEIKEDSDAVFRRFIMIEFPVSFINDKNVELLDELREEKQGIFNLLLQVANCLQKRKHFCYEQSVAELRVRWKEKSNPVYNFIFESGLVVKDANGEVSKTQLYKQYVSFCTKSNYTVKQQREFTLEVKRFGIEETRTTKERLWRGIRLNSPEEKEMQEKL